MTEDMTKKIAFETAIRHHFRKCKTEEEFDMTLSRLFEANTDPVKQSFIIDKYVFFKERFIGKVNKAYPTLDAYALQRRYQREREIVMIKALLDDER